ncbi:MAG: hypothetical protein A4E60_02879 [Syntrophorhabdus sp. PtaB.Bin047]|jgi:hypothetical protein|nr:MAG: hypothetical protein A4E60_02879 [Syntrophorhabdus sp. PtaB.Bin047]
MKARTFLEAAQAKRRPSQVARPFLARRPSQAASLMSHVKDRHKSQASGRRSKGKIRCTLVNCKGSDLAGQPQGLPSPFFFRHSGEGRNPERTGSERPPGRECSSTPIHIVLAKHSLLRAFSCDRAFPGCRFASEDTGLRRNDGGRGWNDGRCAVSGKIGTSTSTIERAADPFCL